MTILSLPRRFIVALIVFSALGLLAGVITTPYGATKSSTFSLYVDEKGRISLPKNFRTQWAYLGTYSVREKMSGYTLHEVFTQPSSVEAYRKTGAWPDGAVLVKEIRRTTSAKMTTGRASWATEINIWFVMIKDTKGRFPDNPNWGAGWGWALYEAKDPNTNVSTDYKLDCIPCHIPARNDDWVYIEGYPTLNKKYKP